MKKKQITEKTFRKIPSLKFLYEVNPYGILRNVKSKKTLKGFYDKDGYHNYRMNNKTLGVNTTIRAHRLVAEVFIPNPNNHPVINHKNEIKDDNYYKNLEWVTVAYNNIYGERLNNITNTWNSRMGDVQMISTGKTFQNARLAAEYIKENNPIRNNTKLDTIRRNINKAINENIYVYGSKWKRITNPID